MEKYINPPTEWVTKDPKLVPTIQCHAGPYTPSNSCKSQSPDQNSLTNQSTTHPNFETSQQLNYLLVKLLA